ncbi:MAG TPA: DinB family protein [Bryobacteraceae bacterium]|nr:DinB family protein [Bryobacteraceae bacterium]
MEKEAREFLLRYLGASRERLLEGVEGLDGQQQRFRPSREHWSIADCVEHITIVERGVLKQIQVTLLGTPHPEIRGGTPDDVILASAAVRLPRFVAPVEMRPRRRWSDFEDLVRQFEAARERTVRFAGITQADLRRHFFAHPDFGPLDCYQWLLFLGAHCERHARQAEEVAGDVNFPRLGDSASA